MLGPKALLFGSLDPYIVPIYPPITPLKGPYYLGPRTLRVPVAYAHTARKTGTCLKLSAYAGANEDLH